MKPTPITPDFNYNGFFDVRFSGRPKQAAQQSVGRAGEMGIDDPVANVSIGDDSVIRMDAESAGRPVRAMQQRGGQRAVALIASEDTPASMKTGEVAMNMMPTRMGYDDTIMTAHVNEDYGLDDTIIPFALDTTSINRFDDTPSDMLLDLRPRRSAKAKGTAGLGDISFMGMGLGTLALVAAGVGLVLWMRKKKK